MQGNTLLGDQVMHLAALAFTRATGTLADRVMAAMEAADANGGDHRCNCGNNPLEHVPCDNKTAHVAYIAIANKDDQAGVTHNDGKYFAYISRRPTTTSRRVRARNPVKTLRMRYDAWKKAGSQRTAPPGPTPFKPSTSQSCSSQNVRQSTWLLATGPGLPPRPRGCGGFFSSLY